MKKKKEAAPAPVKASAMKGVKSQIQASIDRAHEEHKRELFRKRLSVARQGVRDYQLKRIGDAVKAFQAYLRILEDWKGVPEGGLHPGLFNMQGDIPELILIAGVYWDLAKLFDRTQKKEEEFREYLEKFLIFSKGMPFQPLSGETLRKYISNEKPVHREEFKNAYKALTGSSCFIATSLMDVSDEHTIVRLRHFRDQVLRRSVCGRAFESWYYRSGPRIARFLDSLPDVFRHVAAGLLTGLSVALSALTRCSRR